MVAGEVRDPARLIPRALALGIAIIMVCYLGVNVAYLHVLGRDGMAASTSVAADTAIRMVGSLGGTLITIAAMVSILGLVNVVLLATPRIFYAMAREGLFYPGSRAHPSALRHAAHQHCDVGAVVGRAAAARAISAGLAAQRRGVRGLDFLWAERSERVRVSAHDASRSRARIARGAIRLCRSFFVAASIAAVGSAVVSAPIPSAFGAFSGSWA